MRGDGDGWAEVPGGRAWGRFGAAGLFLYARSAGTVLMQHRALWTMNGGTWGLPGGARDSTESPAEAAVREAVEETAIDAHSLAVVEEIITAGPFPSGWFYTTVLALAEEELDTTPNEESADLRWVPLEDVDKLPLLPAFAESLPNLRRRAQELWQAGAHD